MGNRNFLLTKSGFKWYKTRTNAQSGLMRQLGPPAFFLQMQAGEGAAALFGFEEPFGEAREKADPERQGIIVEVVAGVVKPATALARAVADPQHRARHRLQHVGKILTAERRRYIAVDPVLTADLGRDIGRERRLVGVVDRRRVAAAVVAFG